MTSISGVLVFALVRCATCAAAAPADDESAAQAEGAYALRKTNPDEAMRLFDRALPALKGAGPRLKALRARCWLGVDEAAFLPRATAAIEEARNAADSTAVSALLACRGTLHERRNRTDAAFADLDTAVDARVNARPMSQVSASGLGSPRALERLATHFGRCSRHAPTDHATEARDLAVSLIWILILSDDANPIGSRLLPACR